MFYIRAELYFNYGLDMEVSLKLCTFMLMPCVINRKFKMPHNLVIRKTLDSMKTKESNCIQNTCYVFILSRS